MGEFMKKVLILMLFLLGFTLTACNSAVDKNFGNLFSDGLFAVSENGNWGYINDKGEEVIPLVYDSAGTFFNGLAVVRVDSDYYIIDKEGKNILDENYEFIRRDKAGDVFIYEKNDKYGLLNSKGEELTDALYDSVKSFSEGLAPVRSGDMYGYINSKGAVVISLEYEDAYSFSNGLAVVGNNDKYGYINDEGEEVIDLAFDDAYNFDENDRAIVYMYDEDSYEDFYSLINKKGEKIISDVDDIDYDGGAYYSVVIDDEYFIYDAEGELFNDEVYTDIWFLNGFMANVETEDDGDINVLFDKNGEIIESAPYNDSEFTVIIDGNNIIEVLYVYDDEYIDVYTKDDTFRIKADDIIQVLSNDRFIVERNGKVGIINGDGEILVQFLYDILFSSKDGYIVFEINGLYGIMDNKYKTIISATYDDIDTSFAGYYTIY